MEALKMLVVFIFLFISYGKSDPALHRIAGGHLRPKPMGLPSEAYHSCVCFNTSFPTSLDDVMHQKPGLKRLVVYLYKDPKSGLQMYVPNKDVQPQFPELGWENGELFNVQHETLNEVFDNNYNVFDMDKFPNYSSDHVNSLNHEPSDGSYTVYTETHESYPVVNMPLLNPNFETNPLSPGSESSVTPIPFDISINPNGLKPGSPKPKGLPVIEVPLLDLQSNPLQPISHTDNGQSPESLTPGPSHFLINAKHNFYVEPQLNNPKTDDHKSVPAVKVPVSNKQPKVQIKPVTNDQNLSIQPPHVSTEFSFDSKHNHPISKDQDSSHIVNLPLVKVPTNGNLPSVNNNNNPQPSPIGFDISVHTNHYLNDALPNQNGRVVNLPLININSDKKPSEYNPGSILWSHNTYHDSNDIPKHDYLITEDHEVKVPVVTVRPITNLPSLSLGDGDGSQLPPGVQGKPVPLLYGVDGPQESGNVPGIDSFYNMYTKNPLERDLTLNPHLEIIPGRVKQFSVPGADGFDVNVYDYLKFPTTTAAQDNNLITENEYLTFDRWFAQQMQKIQNTGQSPKKNIDVSSIKNLLEKTLYENGLIVTKDGVLTDSKANALNMANVKLRPILIGDSVAYHNLFLENQSGQYELPRNLPYLESVLVTLVHPPRILGVIPLGRTFVPSTQLDRLKQYHSYYQSSASQNQQSVKHKNVQLSKKEGLHKNVKGRVQTKYYQNMNFNQRPQVITPDYRYRLSWDKVLESLFGSPNSTKRIGNPFKKSRKSNDDEFDNSVDGGPEEYEPEEGLPGFRIIGGHPATSSGTPVSSKGRIGLKV